MKLSRRLSGASRQASASRGAPRIEIFELGPAVLRCNKLEVSGTSPYLFTDKLRPDLNLIHTPRASAQSMHCDNPEKGCTMVDKLGSDGYFHILKMERRVRTARNATRSPLSNWRRS